MRLVCVGLSHATASLPLREAMAFSASASADVLASLRRRWPKAEFLLLCTCNRTELYTARPLHGRPREDELRAVLVSRCPAQAEALGKALYVHTDAQAVRHIFSVAAGLMSLVPGEPQIVSQIKKALEMANQARAAGSAMPSLVREALHVAKHVRSETSIAAGKVSVASVAFDAIEKVFPSLHERCVLVVGGGKMTELLLRLLRESRAGRILVANRSPKRAEELAAASKAQVVPLETLGQSIAQADVVVTATASPEPILTAEQIRHARQEQNHAPLLLIDLAVPRDIDPQAGQLDGVELWNLDDLGRTVAKTLHKRSQHFDAAKAIVDAHVTQYVKSANVQAVAPTIDALYRRIETTLETELADAANKLSTHSDQKEDMDILQRTLHRALRRFCHPAVETLRAEAENGAGAAHAETLRTLFDLENDTL